jgi:hypothetical protein
MRIRMMVFLNMMANILSRVSVKVAYYYCIREKSSSKLHYGRNIF